MPRFFALEIEHKLDDLISICVSAVVLAAAQILQESSRFFFEFAAKFASLIEMSNKQSTRYRYGRSEVRFAGRSNRHSVANG